jgi:hypothetical protein
MVRYRTVQKRMENSVAGTFAGALNRSLNAHGMGGWLSTGGDLRPFVPLDLQENCGSPF